MDIEKIFALIDRAQMSSFDRIEIETEDVKIRLERQSGAMGTQPRAVLPVEGPIDDEDEREPAYAAEDTVTTPISGVFYAQSQPGAEPYVGVGSRVEEGQPLCIIEAMKTMNEICAPKAGVIERIFVEDSEAVTAGDALFVFEREE